jgi:hypothetical protein
VVEIEVALHPELEHRDRGHRLGDRADPVLLVQVAHAGRARPSELAVGDHPSDHPREATARLQCLEA